MLALSDNRSAISWVSKCGGTKYVRAAAGLGLGLGKVDLMGSLCQNVDHEEHNVLADGISRWHRSEITAN